MKRNHLVTMALSLLLLSLPAAVSAQAIGKAMGNLRWGMSDLEVKRVAETKIRDLYAAKMKKAKGASKAALERELAGKLRDLGSSHTELDGKRSRWDNSPIAGEFTYDNDEALLAGNDGDADNYYFFIGGKLWKWVKIYPASSFGGRDFKKFSSAINKKFGKGYQKSGEVNESGKSYTFLEYTDRRNRLRAVDRTSDAHGFALVFEELDTVRQLASLRPNAPKKSRAASRPSPREEEEDEAPVASRSSKSKRSLFAGESQAEESEQQYEARKRELIASKKEQARRKHELAQEAKKAKALDSLQGVDDDDPLSGM